MKNALNCQSMMKSVRNVFKKASPDSNTSTVPIEDCLMSGLALFALKYPSLLQFDNDRARIAQNMKNLFMVDKVPSDTYLRERLDEVEPSKLRSCFTRLFSAVQRSKKLEAYQYINGSYCVSLDASGYFSSKTIHCDECCTKKHRDGTTTYYHQILQAAMVHPQLKQVIPFAPEPICNQDGTKKNDCERNAAKRLLADMRREHPHLDITILADGLYSNDPFLELLEKYNMHYIITAKPGDHAWLFDYVQHANCESYEIKDSNGYTHQFQFINDAPLNESNENRRVNFIDYKEISPKGKTKKFTWITDFRISEKNVFALMRGGRARWRIENETFNTLKNQGYHFEHNFGHGYKHLSHIFANLMLLAFMIDQIQEMGCKDFKKALQNRCNKLSYLWQQVRFTFFTFVAKSWQHLYQWIGSFTADQQLPLPDTS